MVRIPVEKILTISHIREHSEVIDLLELGTTEEGLKNYDTLILRRLIFDDRLCIAFKETLRKRQGCHWKRVELRNIDGDVTSAITTCLNMDATLELYLVLNAVEISQVGWMALSKKIQTPHSILQSLRITTTISGTAMQVFSEGLTNAASSFHTLDFSWSTFESGDAVEALVAGLRHNRTLHDLHFMGCSLSDQHMAWIIGALRDHSTLQCLDLNGNKCGPRTSVALDELLTSDTTQLQKLDLSFQTCDRPLLIQSMVDGLRQNKSLKVLELSNCHLNDADAILLGQLLCTGSNISDLYIARNKITDAGIMEFGAMIPKMKILRRLSIWGNPFDDPGAQALADGMKDNWVIEELGLFRNFSCTDQIGLYIDLNKAGRRLLYCQDPLPLGLWPFILSRINSFSSNKKQKHSTTPTPDLLYHMIRGPALFESR